MVGDDDNEKPYIAGTITGAYLHPSPCLPRAVSARESGVDFDPELQPDRRDVSNSSSDLNFGAT